MRIIVSGLVGLYPVGGVAWDYLQYVTGLAELGHDVYYYEDTWSWPFDPVENTRTDLADYSVAFIESFFDQFAPQLANRWHYRHLHDQSYGLRNSAFDEIASTADVFLNISGGNPMPPTYPSEAVTVFIDTDPGYNQSVIRERFSWSANVDRWRADFFQHDRFVTYAENIGRLDCEVPDIGIDWFTTRMPIVLTEWPVQPPATHGSTWSTIMTWNAFAGPVIVNGVEYGSKNVEFPKIESLPTALNVPFKVAMGGVDAPHAWLKSKRWNVIDAPLASKSPKKYQQFIQQSRGEISVAKNIYAEMNTGWFSCRSACYLASGRPVVTQDTGFSKYLPTGEGLFAFTTTEEAIAAIETVESDYERHSKAAREIAEEYFDSRNVLTKLLDEVFSESPPHRGVDPK